MVFGNQHSIVRTVTQTGSMRRALGRCLRLAACLAIALAGALPAHANTYLFSFTGAEIKAALQAADGPLVFSESAYFAIFLQPDPVQISNYTYQPLSSPNPTGDNPWSADTITDPSSPDFGYSLANPCTSNCTWAGYSKGATQTDVTVLSGTNIFLGGAWASFGTPPVGWGGTVGIIQSLMPDNAVFQFGINIAGTLSGSYTVRGYASRLQSGNPGYMSGDTKEDHGVGFSLTDTPSSSEVPEPSTLALGAAGAIAFFLLRRRRTGAVSVL
jgi:hypothetical protein